MAAHSHSRGLVGFGKRFVNQIRAGSSRDPSHSPSLALRRAVHVSVYDKNIDNQVHVSVYDKNIDDQVRPTIVPDDVIQPESDKYWAPHPQTGVFGPASEQSPATGAGRQLSFHSSANGTEGSVLELKAFFRPLEDLEKPIEN